MIREKRIRFPVSRRATIPAPLKADERTAKVGNENGSLKPEMRKFENNLKSEARSQKSDVRKQFPL